MGFAQIFFILLTFNCGGIESKSVKESPKIVIIGAGIAGLSAAAKLEEENNFTDYVILEATDRTGGRMKTLYQEQDGVKYPLELGAGWIHGTKNNPIYDLAKKHNLLTSNSWTNEEKNERFSEYAREVRLEDSSSLPRSLYEAVYNAFESATDKAGTFYDKGLPSGYSAGASVESYILDEFYKEFNGTSDASKWLKQRSVLESLLSYETWDAGCHSMQEVSLKYYGSFQELGDTDVSLPGGYVTVVNVIKQNIPSTKIKFNHIVEKIEYSSKTSTVTVKCQNGQTFEADHVIVTSSLGYLKSNAATMFDPPLSQKKMSAINRLGFGTADRIYLEFESLDFITNREVGEIYFVREPSDLQDTTDWLKKVFVCYVEDVPKANVLTCWLTGKQAEEMEKRSDGEVTTKMRELLQQFLGTTVPVPLKMIRSRWYSDQFTKGVYSFIKVGSTLDDVKTLAEPLYFQYENYTKPIVMFAGEATHEEYYSSVHGAYLSGIRAADELINSAGKPMLRKTLFIVVFLILCVIL